MTLLDIFKKEVQCDNCRITISKKQLTIFDTTIQGRNKGGQVKKVCSNCMMDLFYKSIKEFNDIAVIVYPIRNLNAYVFYNFEELLNIKDISSKEKNKKLVKEMKKLMPLPHTQCNNCRGETSFTWCSSDIFNNDPYIWEVNKVSKLDYEYLCKECLIREFKRKIEEENISLQAIYPPSKGQGFCTSWEL